MKLWNKFKNNPTSYRLIGYSTTYETMKGKRAYDRISQFLILPAYQKRSFGKSLVEGIYDYYTKDKSWEEINVEKPTHAFKRLRDSVEFNLVSQKGYLKAIDDLVVNQTKSAESKVFEIVIEIHQKLKISNSRIIKILQSHYNSKKELVYKQSSSNKNWYGNFKQIISSVKIMLDVQKGSKRACLFDSKVSPKRLRSKSNGRQGMKNPRKRLRERSDRKVKYDNFEKIKSCFSKEEDVKECNNAKVSTLSMSSFIQSLSSDSDSDWQSPYEDTRSNNSRHNYDKKLRSLQLDPNTAQKSKTKITRATKRKKISDSSESEYRPSSYKKPCNSGTRFNKVIVTRIRI